jgi:catechol 2,3-dioxygenase-like lactoylglutathione lyase family enzyme
MRVDESPHITTADRPSQFVEKQEREHMLSGHPANTTLPASNLERAVKFYGERLGLVPASEDPGGVTYQCSGTRFVVFPSQGDANGAFTQMSWTVDHIDAEVAELKSRGVVFEEYDTPSLKTVNGVASMGPVKGAWFKDSEGNLLSLIQF